jgi:hypothetical protein
MRGVLPAAAFSVLILLACSSEKTTKNPDIKTVTVNVGLNGPVYRGAFYQGYLPRTDVGIWIADANQNYVKTLKITPSIVSVGEYPHISHLPTWAVCSGVTYEQLQQETGNEAGIAPSFEAVTFASPYFATEAAQTVSAVWDLTDRNGSRVSPGVYYLFAETANITKNDSVLVTIDAEHTSARLNLVAGAAEPAALTPHIRSVAVSFDLSAPSSSSKAGGVFDLE